MKGRRITNNWKLYGMALLLVFSVGFGLNVGLEKVALANETTQKVPAECPKAKEVSINVGTSALLLLHMENDLIMPEGKLAGHWWKRIRQDKTIQNAKAVLEAAREAGMFVVFVNIGFQSGYPEVPPRKYLKGYIAEIVDKNMLLQGTWGALNIDELKPLKNEPIVWNYTAGAFEATALDRMLRNRGITSVFLLGVATNYVVENTMREGRDKGYQNFILMDCCNAASQDWHCWPLANTIGDMAVVTDSTHFIQALKGKK